MAINIVMGKPGVGKSTFSGVICGKSVKTTDSRIYKTKFVRKLLKSSKRKNLQVFSNVSIEGAKRLNIQTDINKFLIENAVVIIDEAGFEFNSRNFKKFNMDLYRWFSLHRHYNCDVWLFVQHWERVDLVLRELVHRIYVVTPTLLKFGFIKVKEIKCSIAISEDKQIVEQFEWRFPLFGTRYYYHKKARKLFNSYERDSLPIKNFQTWFNSNQKKKDNQIYTLFNKALDIKNKFHKEPEEEKEVV